MRTLRNLALGALLALSAGCTLTLDPESVDAPSENPPPPPPPPPVTLRGSCIDSPGHRICGGEVSGGAAELDSAGHRIVRGKAGTPTPDIDGPQHRIIRGDVSP